MTVTPTPEMLADLRKKAECLSKDPAPPNSILHPPEVRFYAALSPAVLLALLDRIEALERERRETHCLAFGIAVSRERPSWCAANGYADDPCAWCRSGK